MVKSRQDSRVYVGLGANLGDRQANILQALQYIQTRASIDQVSSFYETEPVGYTDQPKFLNAVCAIRTALSPGELLHFLKWIEKRMGRMASFRNAPRPIDMDILLYDDLIVDETLLPTGGGDAREGRELIIPHPRMHERAFVLAPLVEIAPDVIHPGLNAAATELLARIEQDKRGVKRIARSLKLRLEHDVQQARPEVTVSLSRVGVTNLRRIIRIAGEADGGQGPALLCATFDLFADLNPEQAGVHMSRFNDALEALVADIALKQSAEPTPDVETLVERLARQVVQSQQAIRSEVRVRAEYPMTKITPVSGRRTEELVTLVSIAAAQQAIGCNKDHQKVSVRSLVGVEVNGLTVCPCAQGMMRDHSRELLLDEGFSERDAERILSILPAASHNQRGRGTLLLGSIESQDRVRAEHLVHIVEASMSAETYELLKRPDEFFVVNKAHRNPRFVEDVVREMLRNVVAIYPDLPDETFVLAKQENLESIHRHNAFAERYGALGEIRRELQQGAQRGARNIRHTTLDEWLRTNLSHDTIEDQ